ncbi:molybdenum cofactor guanylyltransferase [Microbacterium kribbense]|uniref:Molybdenum cofactor guanylyltransferase n=1 Tax=Microbacterium kribbense TaxID=433645 RepID=A0ABP7GHU2_9MICO
MTERHATFGAILLAGGRASRMGGIDKPRLVVDGVSLIDRAVAAVREIGAAPIVAVGPSPDESDVPERPDAPGIPDAPRTAQSRADVRWVREDPPFTGPAAAIVAALDAMPADSDPDWMFLLACDLPRVDAAVRQLVRDIVLLPSDTAGACLTDASSRPQWLTGAYRTRVLRTAAAALPEGGRDASIRALLADLAIAALADPTGSAEDIDTWADLEHFTTGGA